MMCSQLANGEKCSGVRCIRCAEQCVLLTQRDRAAPVSFLHLRPHDFWRFTNMCIMCARMYVFMHAFENSLMLILAETVEQQ